MNLGNLERFVRLNVTHQGSFISDTQEVDPPISLGIAVPERCLLLPKPYGNQIELYVSTADGMAGNCINTDLDTDVDDGRLFTSCSGFSHTGAVELATSI